MKPEPDDLANLWVKPHLNLTQAPSFSDAGGRTFSLLLKPFGEEILCPRCGSIATNTEPLLFLRVWFLDPGRLSCGKQRPINSFRELEKPWLPSPKAWSLWGKVGVVWRRERNTSRHCGPPIVTWTNQILVTHWIISPCCYSQKIKQATRMPVDGGTLYGPSAWWCTLQPLGRWRKCCRYHHGRPPKYILYRKNQVKEQNV